MNANEIKAAAVKANKMAQAAWRRGGDCGGYRTALAEYTTLCAEYEALTGQMLRILSR